MSWFWETSAVDLLYTSLITLCVFFLKNLALNWLRPGVLFSIRPMFKIDWATPWSDAETHNGKRSILSLFPRTNSPSLRRPAHLRASFSVDSTVSNQRELVWIAFINVFKWFPSVSFKKKPDFVNGCVRCAYESTWYFSLKGFVSKINWKFYFKNPQKSFSHKNRDKSKWPFISIFGFIFHKNLVGSSKNPCFIIHTFLHLELWAFA